MARTARQIPSAAVGALCALIALWALIAAAPAQAAVTSVLNGATVSGSPVPCTAGSDGVRICHGTFSSSPGGADLRFKSFDSVPLEVYVILPPAPATGTDGGYPLIDQAHGWGGKAGGAGDTQFYGPTADAWAKSGYAVVQLTDRGWADSCGSAASRLADPAGCQSGYIRLDDDRYEIRDVQTVIGDLVDEGIADPARLGVTGESYGGGLSLQLATLKDRIMNSDGSLSPWTSGKGTPLHIAAAAPIIPWSDLVYSLVPNGRTLDTQVTSADADRKPIGVEKQSFVSGLYALGQAGGYYAPPGTDSSADLTPWYARLNAGEPYDGDPTTQSILDEIASHHSAYYLLDGAYGAGKEPPPPLLIANGFTDDLFPVDEAIRYRNLDNSLYPGDPVHLFAADFGHQRGQNKPADLAVLAGIVRNFFDHYLRGSGSAPAAATALTQTCGGAPSGGPFTAPSWEALHPGEVDYSATGAQASQTVTSVAGNPNTSATVDPIAGGGACATVPASDEGAGVATYRLPAATGAGYTLLGAPVVVANLNVTGTFAYLAARLWDVNPATGTQSLVDRGLYRIDAASPNGVQTFELHPGAWHFAAGHVPKLELLGRDVPYARASNGQFQIAVSGLQLRLPVHDAPGTATPVASPLPPVSNGKGTPVSRPAPACGRIVPSSRIDKRHAHADRRGLVVSGTAAETPCSHASAATRRAERVVRVYVVVYHPVGRRCIFLQPNGRLTRPRSCDHAVRFAARGTTRWSLRIRRALPRGHFLVRSDAVDGRHVHQHHTAASVTTVVVR